MKNKLILEGKMLAVSLFVGVLIAVGAAAYTYSFSAAAQRDIAENVIRFHVLAHSDDAEAQALKEYVRLEVLSEFADTLRANNNIEETRRALADSLPAIQEHAESAVLRAGFDEPVSAKMSTVFFPTRVYGSMVFPPGEYETVQIIIGDGGGGNWWCLMFPPLCYIDMTASNAGRRQLAETVSADSFGLLTHQERNTELEIRFRIVEWWQNRR